jgi:hypothetical protein
MNGTCVACNRANQQVERIVRGHMEIMVCLDTKACMARWQRQG